MQDDWHAVPGAVGGAVPGVAAALQRDRVSHREGLGLPRRTAHDFAERRVFEVGEPGTVLAFRQEQVPQPGGPGFAFSLSSNGTGCQRSPSSTCANSASSFGQISSAMKASTRACNAQTFSECSNPIADSPFGAPTALS